MVELSVEEARMRLLGLRRRYKERGGRNWWLKMRWG
jgi:hypothetical protein